MRPGWYLWRRRGIERSITMATKSAVRPHHTATSDKSWDGPRAETRLDNDADNRTLRKVFAWVDADNPESETDAKFPHHEVSADGKIGAANLRACTSGIGILNGAHGGADLPREDREAVYRHLATHLEDGGEDAPELK
jgi:hypothetical protein